MRGARKGVRVLALAAALLALAGSGNARADDARPADVPAAWAGAQRALALPPLPSDFARVQRGPVAWIHPRAEAARVDALEEQFKEHWGRIAAELGRDLDPSMIVVLARDLDELRALAPIGHPPPRYAVGVAYPAAGIVMVSLEGHGIGSRPDVESVFVHELAHVALERAVDAQPVPRWFSEGLAIRAAREQTLARTQTLFRAYVEGDLPPLRTLDASFSGRAFEVDVAYAGAADAVGYLARVENGPRKLRRLVAGLRRGEPFEEALKASHYVSLEGLDREWRDDVRERYGQLPVIAFGSALWCAATVLLVLAWRKRRNEHRRKLRRLEHEEIALDRIEALLAAKLDEGPPSGATLDLEDDDERPSSPELLPLPSPDDGVPTVVHRGRSHTLH